MSYFCGKCGSRNSAPGACGICGTPLTATAESAYDTTVFESGFMVREDPQERMLHLLREAWRRGEPGVSQEDMLRRERNRLGLDDGRFAALDLVARGELGLLAEPVRTAVGLSVGLDGPAQRGVPFILAVRVENHSAQDYRSVRVRVESPYLSQRTGLESFPLPAGGIAEARGEFLADEAHPDGAPVRMAVEAEDRHGIIRVYRPEDRIRIPVRDAAGDRAGTVMVMHSAAGGLSRTDIGRLPEDTISDLRRGADRGLAVRLDMASLAGLRAGAEGGTGLTPVSLRLDRDRSRRLERRYSLPPPSPLAAPVERALFHIEENGRARRIHLLPKGTTVFGRPLGPADMWLGAWDDAGEPDLNRTGKISARHFAIRYDGLFYIRDLGSANGVRVNNELLGEAWRPLSHRDRIVLARGALTLTALMDMTPGNGVSMPVGANMRLVRDKESVEEYIILPRSVDIGSAPDCPLRLESASELSARLIHDNGRLFLIALDGSGGVLVDGTALEPAEPALLADMQFIRIGGAGVTVSLG